ncbi:MAG: TIGR04150 pseudo-rSAM protein [Bacteroidales bacterium]|nr:TIGR04150 pseudo-rSAM protein [Bacteroidales bacterium]
MEKEIIKKGCWLVIEPYVFIFKGKNEYVLYNTLSNKMLQFDVENNAFVADILEQLTLVENLYSIEISENDCKTISFKQFVSDLRDGFFGDVYSKELYEYHPISLPPLLKVKNSIKNINKNVEQQDDNTFLNFFHELSVYLNGTCTYGCKLCTKYYKQIPFCCKSKSEFDKNELDNLFDLISHSPHLIILNIFGGDILKYNLLEYFLDKIEELSHSIEINIFLFYKACNNHFSYQLLNEHHVNVHILFPINNFDNEDITHILSICSNFENAFWDFVCQNENEYNNCINFAESHGLEKYDILPFYEENADFFKKYVFITKDDLLNSDNSKRNIFIKQQLNSFFYGKLVITTDKLVFDCINGHNVGTLGDDIVDLIKKCVNEESVWFLTRNKMKPCCDCAFQYLCPPPSNYEAVIGKPNLCNIMP